MLLHRYGKMSRTYVHLSSINEDELCSYAGFFDKVKIRKVIVFKPFSFKRKKVGKALDFFTLVVKIQRFSPYRYTLHSVLWFLWTHPK